MLMSVNPGFGGQSFIEGTYAELNQLVALCREHDVHPLIELDGGVSVSNAAEVAAAGADSLSPGPRCSEPPIPIGPSQSCAPLPNPDSRRRVRSACPHPLPQRFPSTSITPRPRPCAPWPSRRRPITTVPISLAPIPTRSTPSAAAPRLHSKAHDATSPLPRLSRPQPRDRLHGRRDQANHLALLGIAEGVRVRDRRRNRVVVSAIEHDSILDNLGLLRDAGFDVTTVRPDSSDVVSPDTLARVIDERRRARLRHAREQRDGGHPARRRSCPRGARRRGPLPHGRHPGLSPYPYRCGRARVSAHPRRAQGRRPCFHRSAVPRSRTPLRPQLFGGGQESGRRPGTQDVRSALALSAVARMLAPTVEQDRIRLQQHADALYRRLCEHPSIVATMGTGSMSTDCPDSSPSPSWEQTPRSLSSSSTLADSPSPPARPAHPDPTTQAMCSRRWDCRRTVTRRPGTHSTIASTHATSIASRTRSLGLLQGVTMTVDDLLVALEQRFPASDAEAWDHVRPP